MHPNYLDCQHLRTVSKDVLLSHLYESPSIWGEHQNTPCSGFAKGPRFLNMVMTFVLTPLSHHNSITKPHAQFLLSLLKDLSINFPSHFNISIIDVYRDTTTRDKLIFPSAITQILRHSWFLYPILKTEIALIHHILSKNYCVFAPRVWWPRSFLIFIVGWIEELCSQHLF